MTDLFNELRRLPDTHPVERLLRSAREELYMRPGFFRLPACLVKASPETAMRLFREMVIVRAEHRFIDDTFEYYAFSPLFRLVNEGDRAPFYKFEIDDEIDVITAVETGHD